MSNLKITQYRNVSDIALLVVYWCCLVEFHVKHI